MAYKDEMKKEEQENTLQQTVGASKATSDKAKKLNKAEGDKSPQVTIGAAKTALMEPKRKRKGAGMSGRAWCTDFPALWIPPH